MDAQSSKAAGIEQEPPQVNNPNGTGCRIKSGVTAKKEGLRGIPRGTEQSNKPLTERKKENGKDHDDVRNCVHIGTRRELLLSDDEGDREGVHAPS